MPNAVMNLRVSCLLLFLLCGSGNIRAQSYRDSFLNWQSQYKKEFLTDTRSPLKASDTGSIRFFPYNPRLLFHKARVRVLKNQKIEPIATHSGKIKRVRAYAIIHCIPETGFWSFLPAPWRSGDFDVTLYQILPAGSDSATNDALFLPFYDATNGLTTYGGGRYIDLHIADIQNGQMTVDFNRAYNPWCAYKEGYNCPIPPEANHLNRTIKAGEKLFAGKVAD